MRIVIAFAPEDRAAKAEFEKHLFKFKDVIWDSSQIAYGELQAEELKANYSQANYVIVLLSVDFLSNEALMAQLRDLHFQKQTKILPVIFRPCLWQASDFAALKTIPADHEPLIGGDDSKNDGRFLMAAREIYEFLTGSRRSAEALPPLPKSIEPPKDPFLGSTWFKRSDAPVFFGRNQEIKALLELIEQDSASVVAIFGQSGAGKSSLLEAGVLPRLEANWRIAYLRRNREKGITAMLKEALEALPSTGEKCLLILDQLEEMFTNPNPAFPDEKELFFQAVKSALETRAGLKLVFGFRKEYYTDLKAFMKAQKLRWEDFPLEPLDRDDVLEAIEGVTLNKDLQWEYELQIEQGLAFKIASDILQDSSSNVAPFLQMQLRKMWDAVKDGAAPRVFSEALYAQFRVASFDALLSAQLADLATDAAFSSAVHSGLVLDLLYFFTTETGTSAQRSQSELLEAYEGKPFIVELLEALKRRYLLTEVQASPDLKGPARLGHDALALLVVRHFNRSDAPGQQATRFLASALATRSALTKAGLKAVQNGLEGRRKLSAEEALVYENGLQTHYKSIARDMLGENKVGEALELLSGFFERQRDGVNQKEVMFFQAQLTEINRHRINGTQHYDEIVRAISQLRQAILTFLRASERTERLDAWKKMITFLLDGNLGSALAALLEWAETQGNPEWLDRAKMFASGYANVRRDFEVGIISAQDYLRFNSRTLHDMVSWLIEISKADAAYPDLEAHFWETVPLAFPSPEFLDIGPIVNSQEHLKGDQYPPERALAVWVSLFNMAMVKWLINQGLVDFSESSLLKNLIGVTLHNLVSGVFIGKTVSLSFPKSIRYRKQDLVDCIKANDLDTFFQLARDPDEVDPELNILQERLENICFRYALLMDEYEAFSRSQNQIINGLIELTGLASAAPPGDKNFDLKAGMKSALQKVLDALSEEALKELEDMSGNFANEHDFGLVLLLQSRIADISWRMRQGLLRFEDFQLHQSMIRASIRSLIADYLPEDLPSNAFAESEATRLQTKGLPEISVRSIQDKIAEGRDEEALYMAEEMMFRLGEKEKTNEVTLLLSRWHAITRDYKIGVVKFDSFQIVCAQIRVNLLDLIKGLPTA